MELTGKHGAFELIAASFEGFDCESVVQWRSMRECYGALTAFLNVFISGFLAQDLGLGPLLGDRI